MSKNDLTVGFSSMTPIPKPFRISDCVEKEHASLMEHNMMPTKTIEEQMVDIAENMETLKKLEPKELKKEMVDHPDHYNQQPLEAIEVLQMFFKDDPLVWQSMKYAIRYKHKGKPIEDLKKAIWYLQYKIKELEEQENKNVPSN
jgi:hypothetical protein